jgi:hypothetical protein
MLVPPRALRESCVGTGDSFIRLECPSCQEARTAPPFEQVAGFSHKRQSITSPNPLKAAELQTRDTSGWTAPMRVLNAIRDVHTNCGGQIRQRIMEAVRLCGENTLLQGMLGRAVAPAVYTTNAASVTQTFALQALEREVAKLRAPQP